MSALLPSERSEWWAPRDRTCFHCLEVVAPTMPAVFWHGWATQIILHVSCAQLLAVHLIGDAREAQLASGEKHWTRRAAKALRAATVAAETRL